MTRDEKIEKLTEVLSAGKIFTQQAKERIDEKTDEQLDYILVLCQDLAQNKMSDSAD